MLSKNLKFTFCEIVFQTFFFLLEYGSTEIISAIIHAPKSLLVPVELIIIIVLIICIYLLFET